MKRIALSAPLFLALSVALHAQANASLEITFNRAIAAMQAGRYTEAEQDLNTVLAADPANFAALGNLGVLYSRTHRLAEAIGLDQRAVKIDPTDPSILLNLGLAYMKQDAYRQARPYLERLDGVHPGDTRVTLLLATCMILGDAPQQGVDLLTARKMDTVEPSALSLEAIGYARLTQMAAAHAIFNRLLEHSATRAQGDYLIGEALHDGHRIEEAASSFQDVLKLDPNFPGAHRELGKVYISMQHFGEAESELRAALAQDPQDGSALYFLGALLIQTSHEGEGVPYLERAAALMPDAWAIPFYLGKAALHEEHSAEAVPLLEKAASRNADEPQVFYLLSTALRRTGRDDLAGAALARVIALHSSALDAERQAMSNRVAGLHETADRK